MAKTKKVPAKKATLQVEDISVQELAETWDEIQEVIQFEDEPKSSKGLDDVKLKVLIRRASDYIEESDFEDLSEETVEVIKAIATLPPVSDNGEEEAKEAEEATLEDEIVAAKSISELKAIYRENDVFKTHRKDLSMFKAKEPLREKMLSVLTVAEEGVEGSGDEEAPDDVNIKQEEEKPKKGAKEAKEKNSNQSGSKSATKGGEKPLSQTDIIRELIRKKTKKENIEKVLQEKFSQSEAWAKNRFKIYEKAYGDMGKDDPKL